MRFVFGNHERMKDLERRISFIARSRWPVLIEGACGTGKEALAELIHDLSGANTRLTRIVCRKSGILRYPLAPEGNWAADSLDVYRNAGHTVFVKNVHMLSPAEQDQLLVALEQTPDSREGTEETSGAARVLSSATVSLDAMVSRGELNPALYHRLSVYRIYLPPLRNRREDIPELFAQMVGNALNGSAAPPPVASGLLRALMTYDWPGNLRELQNIARMYVVTCDAGEIIEELKSRSHRTSLTFSVSPDQRSLKEQVRGASQRLESEIILRTLDRHRWNRRRAAQTLQISYRSLLYKMKSCNLRTEPEGEREL
ncbi:MAG TPA: sigma 54-interacting transcriptional regulator [Bryobacteraceae bacterium]|nr:sigma 54-interacting transcriptional regulator [Bryobacteraceae bacterium]